jgi:hypothetical protein
LAFRDLQTCHAISDALYHPPIKTPENKNDWPLSHKDKIAEETSKILASMGEDVTNGLLTKQLLDASRAKEMLFMIAPERMSMRFTGKHLRHLKV